MPQNINLFKFSKVNISIFESIKKFIGSKDDPKFFITLTEINKIGINPRSGYSTPLGLYCYPLTEEIYSQLISNSLPFANEKPYVNVFTTSQPLFNLNNYNESDWSKDSSVIKNMYVGDENTENLFQNAQLDAKGKNEIAAKFWNVTRYLSKNSILKWSSIFRNLGYVGFYDPGTGLIHPSEPTQAVILDPSIIIPIESFINPYGHPSYEDDFFNREVSQVEKIISKIFNSKTPVFKLPRDVHKFYGFKILNHIAQAAEQRGLNPREMIDQFKNAINRGDMLSRTIFDEGSGRSYDEKINAATFKVRYPGDRYEDPFLNSSLTSREDYKVIRQKQDKLNKFYDRIANLSEDKILEISKETNSAKFLEIIINYGKVTKEILLEILKKIKESSSFSDKERKYLISQIFTKKIFSKDLILQNIDEATNFESYLFIEENPNVDNEVLIKLLEKMDKPSRFFVAAALEKNPNNYFLSLLCDKAPLEDLTLIAKAKNINEEIYHKIRKRLLNELNSNEKINDINFVSNIISNPIAISDKNISLKIKKILSDIIDSGNYNYYTLLSTNFLGIENLIKLIKNSKDIFYFLSEIPISYEDQFLVSELKNEINNKIIEQSNTLIDETGSEKNFNYLLNIFKSKYTLPSTLDLILEKIKSPYTLYKICDNLCFSFGINNFKLPSKEGQIVLKIIKKLLLISQPKKIDYSEEIEYNEDLDYYKQEASSNLKHLSKLYDIGYFFERAKEDLNSTASVNYLIDLIYKRANEFELKANLF